MPERSGTSRPGGRTARTREAVHAAARELLTERGDGEGELSIPAVAQRAGVHPTTVYRRWSTVESLLLDLAVERVSEESPVPATGDLRADLSVYVHRLLTGLQRAGANSLLQAMIAAAHAQGAGEVERLVGPRVAQFQTMLDAAGVTGVDGLRLTELVLAPAYLWTQLGAPLEPEKGTRRLVETVLALAKEPPPSS